MRDLTKSEWQSVEAEAIIIGVHARGAEMAAQERDLIALGNSMIGFLHAYMALRTVIADANPEAVEEARKAFRLLGEPKLNS